MLFLSYIIESFNNHMRYRRIVSELSRLENYMLDDIGIKRTDIPAVAHKAVYKKKSNAEKTKSQMSDSRERLMFNQTVAAKV